MIPSSQLPKSPLQGSILRSIAYVLVLAGGLSLLGTAQAMHSIPGVPQTTSVPHGERIATTLPYQQVSTGIRSGHNPTPTEIEGRIRDSANKYGLPAERVLRIARCESRLKAGARSKSGLYVGIYQFALKTWRNTPEGKAGLSREDAVANINAAHWHMKRYGYSAWGCK
jgi:hypothetical protein